MIGSARVHIYPHQAEWLNSPGPPAGMVRMGHVPSAIVVVHVNNNTAAIKVMGMIAHRSHLGGLARPPDVLRVHLSANLCDHHLVIIHFEGTVLLVEVL